MEEENPPNPLGPTGNLPPPRNWIPGRAVVKTSRNKIIYL